MGESISARTNQLAYYVPAEYVKMERLTEVGMLRILVFLTIRYKGISTAVSRLWHTISRRECIIT